MKWCAVVLVLTTAGAAAQEGDLSDVEGLLDEGVVSGASSSAEGSSTAPATSSIISADDLRRFGIRSLDQALNFLSLGVVTEEPFTAVDIGARGVVLGGDYGNHMLLLLDGHLLNEQWDGTAYFDRTAAIPLELVDHIEVILGPGSVLYGSNAMLGVINVVTKRAKDFAGVRLVAESELATSARGLIGIGKTFDAGGSKGELTGAIEYTGVDGPYFSYGPQYYGEDAVTGTPKRFSSQGPGTGVWGGQARQGQYYQIPNGYLRANVGDLSLAVRGALSKRWAPYFGNFDDPDSYELDRWLSADARYDVTLSAVTRASLRVYGDVYDYREYLVQSAAEDCLEGQDEGCVYQLDGYSRWAGVEGRTSIDWRSDGAYLTQLGIDGRFRNVGQDITYTEVGALPVSTTRDHHDEVAVGISGEQVARPLSWLGFNGGLRFDYDQRFGTHLSPRFAASVAPWSGGTLKIIYAEAFRAPTAFERYFADPQSFVASPDLKPERERSLEASIEQRVFGQRFFVGVFRAGFTDLVIEDYLTDEELEEAKADDRLGSTADSASKYRNLGGLVDYGGHLAWDGASFERRLRYGLTATVAHARQDAGDGSVPMRLPLAASVFGNARVSYELGGSLPVVALAARFEGSRLVDGSDFEPTPRAKPLVELRAALTGGMPWVAGLSYRLAANVALARHSAYAVGPLTEPTEDNPEQELGPVDRFRVLVGLAYEIP